MIPPWKYYGLPFLASIANACVVGGAGYFVLLNRGSVVLMLSVMMFVVSIGLALIVRWWDAVARDAGMSTFADIRRAQVFCAIGVFAAIAVVVSVEMIAFENTFRRSIEGAIGLAGAIPIGLFGFPVIYRLMKPPKPADAGALRLGAIMQYVLAAIYCANLSLQLHQHRHLGDFTTLREVEIALLFVVIPLTPFGAYQFSQRSSQAKRLAVTLQTLPA